MNPYKLIRIQVGVPDQPGNLAKVATLIGEAGGNVVEVEGGISVEKLNDELFRRGLALSNMGDANPQSISGSDAPHPAAPARSP